MHKILFHCLAGGSLLVAGAAQAQTTSTGDAVVKPAAPAPAKAPAVDAPATVSVTAERPTGRIDGRRLGRCWCGGLDDGVAGGGGLRLGGAGNEQAAARQAMEKDFMHGTKKVIGTLRMRRYAAA